MIPTFAVGQLGRAGAGPGAASAEAAAILSNLAHYWEFEENGSGSTFSDAHGSVDMALRISAGAAQTSIYTGATSTLINRYFYPAAIEGATAYIPVSAGFALPNSSWTFGAWICANGGSVAASSRFIMGNIGSTATDYQASVFIDSSDNNIWFAATTNGSNTGRVVANSGQQFHITLWTLFTATLDRTSNEIRIRLRRSDAGSVTSVGASFPSAIYTGATTANFCINDGLSNDSSYFSGDRAHVLKADQAFYMTKAITDDEFSWLFNSGGGRAYGDLVAEGLG